jgi:hypothetical protein
MSDLSYHPDSFDLDDFTTATSTEVGDDEFETVERLEIGKGEGVYIGQGSSTNPLQAEGSITGDPDNGSDADLTGQYRLVVLNSQNNVVDILTQGKISALRKTRANSLDGDITPFIDTEVMEPYQIGYQLKLASGSDTYSSADSSLEVDGFSGEALN